MVAAIDYRKLELQEVEEFLAAVAPLIILETSSPDKRRQFRELLTAGRDPGADEKHYKYSTNVHFATAGSFGIAVSKTPEQSGEYEDNALEKAEQQLLGLQDTARESLIRSRLKSAGNGFDLNGIDPNEIPLIGMTEDSGWVLEIEDSQKRSKFFEEIHEIISSKLDEDQQWLLEKIEKTGFPGPNFKPVQQALKGSFYELMEDIYEAAERAGVEKLRYVNTSQIALTFPSLNGIYHMEFYGKGDLISRQNFRDKMRLLPSKEALNSDSVHIPDGIGNAEKATIDELKQTILTDFSKDVDISHSRRLFAEWLDKTVGYRQLSPKMRETRVNIAFVDPDAFDGKSSKEVKTQTSVIHDITNVSIPTRADMSRFGNLRHFHDADAVVLVPEKVTKNGHKNRFLTVDPNLQMLINVAVIKETDPLSMNVPIVLDNREGGFDGAIDYFQSLYIGGRAIGDFPFYIANNDQEMTNYLQTVKKIKQASPLTKTDYDKVKAMSELSDPVGLVPNDGVPTFFVGGGHHNNAPKDLREAEKLGYQLAKEGCRIVTGAGSVEGSMGAVHTGFIQYHLDEMRNHLSEYQKLPPLMRQVLEGEEFFDGKRFNAKRLIEDKPALIEHLADMKFGDSAVIPRGMFYGYSMDSLLKMESDSGKPPPGITYHECENLEIRLTGLLSSGNKVIMPGSIGTDQELLDAIKQHQKGLDSMAANNNLFSDGTKDDEGWIVIYNRDGVYDNLLDKLNIFGNSAIARLNREDNNIKVVETIEELLEATDQRAKDWLSREFQKRVPASQSQGLMRA